MNILPTNVFQTNYKAIATLAAGAAAVVALLAMLPALLPAAHGQATVTEVPCGVPTQGGGVAITDGHSTISSSGNSNLQCHFKPWPT